MGLSEEDIKNISQVFIVACGSAYHTGVVTQYVMEDSQGFLFVWSLHRNSVIEDLF